MSESIKRGSKFERKSLSELLDHFINEFPKLAQLR